MPSRLSKISTRADAFANLMSGRTWWTSMDGNLWCKKYARCLVFVPAGIFHKTQLTIDLQKCPHHFFCTISPCLVMTDEWYYWFLPVYAIKQSKFMKERVWHARGNPGGFLVSNVAPIAPPTTIQQRGHCQPTGCFLLGLSPQISNFWNTNKAFWLYCVNVVSPNLTRPRQTYLKVTWNTLCMCCKLSTHMLSWSAGLSSTHAVSLSQYSSEEHTLDHFWFKSSFCSTLKQFNN